MVGGLFEACTGEEHLRGVGKLCGRTSAEVDLLQDQMCSRLRQSFAEASDFRVEFARVFGKFVKQPAGLAAGQPLEVGKLATESHLRG